MQQVKKLSTDPDLGELPSGIVYMSRYIGFMRQPLELYLTGMVTWRECLETMITLLAKEYAENRQLMVEVLKGEQGLALQNTAPIALLLKQYRKPKKCRRKSKSPPRKPREPKWFPQI